MARHAQPRELADLKGAKKKHPERYRKAPPKSNKPLGAPPKHMDDSAKKAWLEIQKQALPGVLTESDRLVMEVLANLLAEFRRSPEGFPAARIGHLVGCLARFGMSPSDRQRLGAPPSGGSDDFADF